MTSEITITDNNEAVLVEYTYPSTDRNPAAVYVASLAERSRRVQLHSLKSILSVFSSKAVEEIDDSTVFGFPWHELRYQHTQAIRSRLAETYSFSTANRCLSALRRVLKECWRLGYMDNETMARTCDIANISGETVPAGRDVSGGEINGLVDACYRDRNEALGIRDMAIIGVLYTTGMRRSELAGLTIEDYNQEEGKLFIRHGKRNKQRLVYIANGAKSALEEWLDLRGSEPGALFLSVRKGGKIQRKERNGKLTGITAQAVYNMLASRAAQAGVADFTPHDLRRTFVGDMLDAGVDIVTVQKMAGHANVTTTGRYDRRGEKAKQEAVKKLHFPYRKRKKLMDVGE